MTVRKRGNAWHYDFTIKRVRYREGIPEARTKSQAFQAETKARQDVFDGKYKRSTGGQLFSAFVEKTFLPWSRLNKRTWYDDQLIAKVLIDFFSGKTFDQITPMIVEKFKKERRESFTYRNKPRQPATVNRELGVLSKIFSLAVDAGVAASNPCSRVRRLRQDNLRTRYLSPEEEARLMQAIDKWPPLDSVVVVALNTGMRRGEILSLAWDQVDFSRRLINITQSKNGRSRSIPMNVRVVEELGRLRASGGSQEYVFRSERSEKHLGWLKRKWERAVLEAEIVNFRFHDLRHTAATRFADGGADAFTIAAILGHATIQMSARYVHATDEGTRRAVDKLVDFGNPGHKSVTKQKRQTLRSAVSS